MRWDALFADLEAEAAGEWQRERDAEIAERTRAELSRLRLEDRLRAATAGPTGDGPELIVRVLAVGVVRGVVTRVAESWFVLVTRTQEWVIAVDAVQGIAGLPPSARPQPPRAMAVSWAAAWRVLARDRAPVQVVRRDASTVDGVAARAGQDYVEISRGPDAMGAGGSELVPYAAIAAVRGPREGV